MLNLKDGTLWQWDKGRKIAITLDEGSIIDKVQFYNGIGHNAYPATSIEVVNGEILAGIPNSLLCYANNLTVYLMTTDEDGIKTQEQITLVVNRRAKPEDYVFTDDEFHTYQVYEERLQYLEDNVVLPERLKESTNAEVKALVPEWAREICPDVTLSESGKAADAAKVGNTIAEVGNAIAQAGSAIAKLEKSISSPYNSKGSVDTYGNLPTRDNVVNDTYYVADERCKYTWNGSAWYQSSLSEADYVEELSQLRTDLNDATDELTIDFTKSDTLLRLDGCIGKRPIKVEVATDVTVTAMSNLAINNRKSTSTTISGVTVAVNADGSYTMDGTATSAGVRTLDGGDQTQTLFFIPKGKHVWIKDCQIYGKYADGTVQAYTPILGQVLEFAPTQDYYVTRIGVFIESGTSYSNAVTRYPMITTGGAEHCSNYVEHERNSNVGNGVVTSYCGKTFLTTTTNTTITATYKRNAKSSSLMSTDVTISANNCANYSDANNLKPNKVYGFSRDITSDMVANLPRYGVVGYLIYIVFKTDTNSGMQLYSSGSRFYYRTNINGTWIAWYEIAFTDIYKQARDLWVRTCVKKPIALTSGKGLYIFGDSITTSTHGGFTWGSVIAQRTGCTEYNYGVGDSAFGYTAPAAKRIITQVNGVSDWSHADYVIVAGGTNDANYNDPLSVVKEKVQEVIDTIKSKAPDAEIIFITPIQRGDYSGLNARLPYISAVICNTALYNNCSVINGFDFPISTVTNEYVTNLTEEGLHPDSRGKYVYAMAVLNALL